MSTRGFMRLLSHSAVAQAISSLVSFGLSSFVMLNAPKADFGRYSLLLGAVLLCLSVAHALIYLQMPVLRNGVEDERRYFATLYRLLLSGMAVVSVLVVPFVVMAWLAGGIGLRGLLLGLAALALLLAQSSVEFARQMHYIREDVASIVRMRLLSASVVALGCVLILYLGVEDILLASLMLFALAQVLGLYCVDYRLLDPRFAVAPLAMARRVWVQGRWALVNAFLVWLPSQGYLYLLTLSAGLGVVAEVNAAYNFVVPLMLLSTSFMQVVLPRLSALPADDSNAANRLRHAVLRLLLGGGLLYVLLLALAFPWLDRALLLPRGYADVGTYVALWLVVALVTLYRSNLAVVFQALNRYHLIVRVALLYAVVGVALAVALILPWGGHGALAAKAGAELVFVLSLRRALYNERRLKKWQW